MKQRKESRSIRADRNEGVSKNFEPPLFEALMSFDPPLPLPFGQIYSDQEEGKVSCWNSVSKTDTFPPQTRVKLESKGQALATFVLRFNTLGLGGFGLPPILFHPCPHLPPPTHQN